MKKLSKKAKKADCANDSELYKKFFSEVVGEITNKDKLLYGAVNFKPLGGIPGNFEVVFKGEVIGKVLKVHTNKEYKLIFE